MIETRIVDYERLEDSQLDVDRLAPIEGRLKGKNGKPLGNAIYFQDEKGNIIAYLSYKPNWGNEEEMVVESFTNESYRKKGPQERLNSYLIRLLREKGCKRITGEIMLNNSTSFLNRLKTKDPDGKGVLKADIPELDKLDLTQPIEPRPISVYLDLHEVVPSNNDLFPKLIKVQSQLTTLRMHTPLVDLIQSK
jgi:hypothetical protein